MVVGLSHHTAPIAVRERIAVPDSVLEGALEDLRGLPSIAETVVVSTCNRVEVYATVRVEPAAAGRAIRDYLSAGDRGIDGHLYERHGLDAIRHLFRVCASLDSMVVGEPQILGQVKEAFTTAEAAGAVGGLLGRSCRRAFAVAKRVRTETQVGKYAVSMSYAAVELAAKILGTVEGRSVLLVGAGKMSALAARHLERAGASRLMVINRSRERADELAREVGGEAHPWDSLPRCLREADVVVCSTAAPEPVITLEIAHAARKARRHRPLFFIDLAVPRDVDPNVNGLDGIYVYDVDDLDKVIDENRRAREEEAIRAEAIVGQEAGAFVAAMRSEAAPILRELRQRGEAIARAEVERTLARLGDGLDEAQRQGIEALSRAILNKLLHEPTAQIRKAGAREDGAMLRAAAELFGIEAEIAAHDGAAPAASLAASDAPPTQEQGSEAGVARRPAGPGRPILATGSG